MRITREIIAPGHRWRAIDNKRMKKICKDVRKLISDFLGPQITRTQASIRKYIERECDQCSQFTCPQERGKCKRCPQEICACCYHEPKVNIYTDAEVNVRIMGEPFVCLCRPCHKESCSLERNAWELIKKFLIQKCHKCTKMITAGAWKCKTCSEFFCEGCGMGTDVYKSVDGTWEYSYKECWECGYEKARALDMIIWDGSSW